MPEMEKVIAGLECCIVRNPDDKMRCTECPYKYPVDAHCLNRLKMDALELLKGFRGEGCGPDWCEIGDDDA